MSSFQHDIAGGQGNLIATSVQSPNFVHGSTGWQVKKDGSAEFNNLTIRGTFNGNNFVLNSTGFFLYSGTPGPGNPPIAYISGNVTADPFGNAVAADVIRSVSGTAFAELASGALIAQDAGGDQVQVTGAAVQFLPSGAGTAGTIQALAGGNELDLLAPVTPGGGNQAEIQLISSATSPVIDIGAAGIPAGNTVNLRGTVNLGASGNAQWADGTQQFTLPAGGGPFIAGETFHTLSNPSGITGTVRVKKLPWNAIWFEGDVTWSGTTGATLTFGTPPDSSYSPASSIRRPVASTGIPSAVSAAPRLFIPSGGGGPQLITQTVTAANSQYGWSIMYPTN